MKPLAPPTCLYCRGAIRKRTSAVHLVAAINQNFHRGTPGFSRYVAVGENWPKTKAECQQHSTGTVVSVSRSHGGSHIASFSEWDGKTYQDEYFCNGDHAKRFGYFAAINGLRRKDKIP